MVVLQRPRSSDQSKPQFLEATVLPGRGMAVLQIKAYFPGKGEINLLNSPPFPRPSNCWTKVTMNSATKFLRLAAPFFCRLPIAFVARFHPMEKPSPQPLRERLSRCPPTGAATSPAPRSTPSMACC